MTALTPEAARAAAEWLDLRTGKARDVANDLRAEADWLEDAAKTPGQVAFRAYHALWTDMPNWEVNGPIMRAQWDAAAAAVIAHHVGPDRVVVDRVDALGASKNLDHSGYHTLAGRIAKALS